MNDIFGFFLRRQTDTEEEVSKRIALSQWFVTSFPAEEFSGGDRIIYRMIENASKLNVCLKEKYINIFLDLSLKTLIIKENLHVDGTEQLFYEDVQQAETAVEITKGVVLSEYYRLTLLDCEVADFPVVANAWMISQLNERLVEIYKSGFTMISKLKDRRIGSFDALDYTSDSIARLKDIYDVEKLEELDINCTKQTSFEFVTDTGLKPVDDDIGGFYTTQMIGVEGITGSGKTKFSIGVCAYRAAVIHHKNVLYYTLEQTADEIRASFIARHVLHLFNKLIDDGAILRDQVPEEYKEMVAIAKEDLFESGKYGKITIVETTLYLESFIDKINMQDKLSGPYDVILIDYMLLIEQLGGQYKKVLQDFAVTKTAYKWFKRYGRKHRKVTIAVNQVSAEQTKAIEQGKAISTVGAAGGMEARRSADQTLVIGVTEAMEAQNKRKIYQPKKRGSRGFGSCIVDTRLGQCYWFVGNNKR